MRGRWNRMREIWYHSHLSKRRGTMGRFEGKVVLVTGGNRNTGLGLMERFVREGARFYRCGSSAASTAKGADARSQTCDRQTA